MWLLLMELIVTGPIWINGFNKPMNQWMDYLMNQNSVTQWTDESMIQWTNLTCRPTCWTTRVDTGSHSLFPNLWSRICGWSYRLYLTKFASYWLLAFYAISTVQVTRWTHSRAPHVLSNDLGGGTQPFHTKTLHPSICLAILQCRRNTDALHISNCVLIDQGCIRNSTAVTRASMYLRFIQRVILLYFESLYIPLL